MFEGITDCHEDCIYHNILGKCSLDWYGEHTEADCSVGKEKFLVSVAERRQGNETK